MQGSGTADLELFPPVPDLLDAAGFVEIWKPRSLALIVGGVVRHLGTRVKRSKALQERLQAAREGRGRPGRHGQRGSRSGKPWGRGFPRYDVEIDTAAVLLGMSEDTLSALLSGRQRRIRVSTYFRLLAVGGGWRSRIAEAVLSPALRSLLVRHQESIDRGTVPLGSQLGLAKKHRDRLRRLRRKHEALDNAVQMLEKVVIERGVSPARRLAAYRAAIAPLYRYYGTDGIERGFDELSNPELAHFVARGLHRERTLLVRAHDLHRAQMAVNKRHEVRQQVREWHLGMVDAETSWDFSGAEQLYGQRRRLLWMGRADPTS